MKGIKTAKIINRITVDIELFKTKSLSVHSFLINTFLESKPELFMWRIYKKHICIYMFIGSLKKSIGKPNFLKKNHQVKNNLE